MIGWLRWLTGVFVGSTALVAQGGVVPEHFTTTRGNDAISLPVRWHQGIVQVLAKQSLLPAGMANATLKSVAVRRPAFLGEPAYPALTRTFSVELASTNISASSLDSDMAKNHTAVGARTAVVSNQTFNIAATLAPTYKSVVGEDLVRVPFATPYVFKGPDLFLEWQTTSTDSGPAPQGWVDALVFHSGGDQGVAVTVGQGGCSSLRPSGLPMTLEADGEVPKSNSTITMRWRQAHPNTPAFLFAGPKLFEPRTSQTGFRVYPPLLTFLKTLALPGCHFWTEPLFVSGSRTDGLGNVDVSLPIPTLQATQVGLRFVFQGATQPDKAPIELTNGVVVYPGSARIGGQAGMVLAPKTFDLNGSGQRVPPKSPWPPFASSLPVLRFGW